MNSGIRFKLFLMMVLEFFIWGAWLPLIFGYLPSLGFTPSQQSWILNAFPIASIVGMFFSNEWADRKFSAEKFLAFSHLIGGLAILGCGFTKDFTPFFVLMLVHCLLYVPTISITNSIAFANMKDASKEFGIVRMGGTIGWILAAWPFTFIFVNWDAVNATHPEGVVKWIEAVFSNPLSGDAAKAATKWTFIVAGIASLILAGFSFLLPHTPPKKAVAGSEGGQAWMQAVKLLKQPFVLVLWLVTLVDSFVHNCYFNWTGTFLGTAKADGGVGIAVWCRICDAAEGGDTGRCRQHQYFEHAGGDVIGQFRRHPHGHGQCGGGCRRCSLHQSCRDRRGRHLHVDLRRSWNGVRDLSCEHLSA